MSKFLTAFFKFGLCLCVSVSARAETPAPVSREAIFVRAFTSTAYVMSMAAMDSAFMSALSADERRMFDGISRVAHDIRTSHWLEARGIPATRQGTSHYVFLGNYSGDGQVATAIHPSVRAELHGSHDQSRFRLRPGEPVRTAVTQDSPHSPIYLNLEIVNNPATTITLAEAFQIMIHEFGHKLGPQVKIQTAVDSMAVKVRQFVEARTSVFTTSSGRVTVLKFPRSNYADWHETTLSGRYVGVNIPNHREPFRAISQEGFYVLVENPRGTFDITSELQSELARDAQFRPYQGSPYSWQHFYFFEPRAVSVRESQSGQIHVEVESRIAQTAIPFLRSGDPDPRVARPWDLVQSRGEYGQYTEHRIESVVSIDGEPHVLSVMRRPLIQETTTVTARELRRIWEGSDLVLTYEVPERVEIVSTGLVETRAFLRAAIGSNVLEIEGQRTSANRNHVTFRVCDAARSLNGSLRMLNIEVEPRVRNLAIPYYVRARLFLESSTPVQLNGRTAPDRLALRSLDGNQIEVLHLIFDSQTELTNLKLQLRIQRVEESTAVTPGQNGTRVRNGPHARNLPPIVVQLNLPISEMRQEFRNGQLHVTAPWPREIETQHHREVDLTPRDLPMAWFQPGEDIRITEEYNTRVLPNLTIEGVEATNASGSTVRRDLSLHTRGGRYTEGPTSDIRATPRASTPSISARSCRDIFASRGGR